MIEQDEKTVAQVVREDLQDCHPGGVTLEVLETGIRKVDYWWRVPVRPNVQPPHTFEYYDALAEVEATLQEDQNTNIILVPVPPEENI